MSGQSQNSRLNEVYAGSYTLRTMRTHLGSRTLAMFLVSLLLILIIVLFLPWQQNIRGVGQLTALNPANRPQTIETVIAGRIQKWFVREGDLVKKGDTIVSITEVKEKYFDPQLLSRLSQQIVAKESSISSKNKKTEALQRQIKALQEGMRLKVEQSKAKLEAEKVKFQNAENQFQRSKKLFEAGNIPLTKLQEVEYKFQGGQAEYLTAKLELERTQAEYEDKISKAESDLNNTFADVFDAEVDILKARNDFVNTQVRNSQYQIVAPQDGYIVKAVKAGIGETIKEGDAVCTIMPETVDMAVEMFVKASTSSTYCPTSTAGASVANCFNIARLKPTCSAQTTSR